MRTIKIKMRIEHPVRAQKVKIVKVIRVKHLANNRAIITMMSPKLSQWHNSKLPLISYPQLRRIILFLLSQMPKVLIQQQEKTTIMKNVAPILFLYLFIFSKLNRSLIQKKNSIYFQRDHPLFKER